MVQILRWRRQALDDTARQALAAAAVLGRRVDGRLLAAMVELEGEAVLRKPSQSQRRCWSVSLVTTNS